MFPVGRYYIAAWRTALPDRCNSIPGALLISKGAVPVKACGLSHMAPTYFVGSRDQSLPSVVVVAAFLLRCGLVEPIWVCDAAQRRRDYLTDQLFEAPLHDATQHQGVAWNDSNGA